MQQPSPNRSIWLLIGALTLIFALLVPVSILVFGVDYDYTLRVVALGGACLGIVSGVLGCFATLRKQSLLGDALSHAALPGVAVAFLVAGRELTWLLLGAGLAGWLAALFINAVLRTTRIKQDTAMGMALAAFFAIGLALLSYIQGRGDGDQAGLNRFIFGQAAAIGIEDVRLTIGVAAGVFVCIGLFWKEFKLLTFDSEFARTNGYPVRLLDTLLSTLVVVAIVLGLQLAGVILMVGLLIGPAVAARQWTNHLGQMVVLSALFGGFSGAAGAIASAVDTGLPTGPMIIVTAFTIGVISISVAPQRGFIWRLWRRRKDKTRFGGPSAYEPDLNFGKMVN